MCECACVMHACIDTYTYQNIYIPSEVEDARERPQLYTLRYVKVNGLYHKSHILPRTGGRS